MDEGRVCTGEGGIKLWGLGLGDWGTLDVTVGLCRLEVEVIACLLGLSGSRKVLLSELMHPQRKGFMKVMHFYKFQEYYHSSVTAHSVYVGHDSLSNIINNKTVSGISHLK